jgi:anti-sigma regulatory factor (Ser/Thr protein kinase)
MEESSQAVLEERALPGWEVSFISLTVNQVLTTLREGCFSLILVRDQVGNATLDSLVDLIREHRGPERIVGVGVGTYERAVNLIRRGAYDCVISDLAGQEFTEFLVRFSYALDADAARRVLYKNIQEERTSYVISSEALGGNLLPLEIVEKLQLAGRLDTTTARRIVVAFQEAITNSHLHGNLALESQWKEDFDRDGVDRFSVMQKERLTDVFYSRKKLVVEINFADDELTIRIRDEGEGFAVGSVETSSDKPFLAGRGLTLMRWGMDSVTFNDQGNEVVLKKQIRKIL